MATKRDLIEAQAFNRRRLVTAFVAGAPGGREVEAPRPWRTVVAGVALGVLITVAAAGSSRLPGHTGVDRDSPPPISSREQVRRPAPPSTPGPVLAWRADR
jgi:hypothetical protein